MIYRIVLWLGLLCCMLEMLHAQCPTCGNGSVDAGETVVNCPKDVAHDVTCISICPPSVSFESTAGIRTTYDFAGTTTWSTSGLPSGWAFAGAPTATTSGALPAADTYGALAGLIQPNCSGSCTGTNGFCIGNLGNVVASGGGGTGGKLGANFDGRSNVNVNASYAVLRGQNNPTLESEAFDFSGVGGFKIQFWLFPSETSCGQSNSWGSCTGNAAFLDFSSDGGTSWTQVLRMDLSTSSTDMCFNNSTNTKWLTENAWSRVCLTVFRTSLSSGNFYSSASASTAASGIMVNSAYFTSTFKFRIRYSQTASCTSGITTTNPGRYLAIDYPVITSGNEMIPCGISFINMCGYGADNNDDGVGSSFSTTNTIVFGTLRRSVNQAERGVEILTSQTSAYASQNFTGSAFASNFDLCNAEGGDKQCIDWRSNNNFYTVVYECLADWEAASGTGINVQYYKGTTAQSTGMTKVTTVGKTATLGWRYSASRNVSCGSVSDLNPGCNGYSFISGSLPIQFARGFYRLATNSSGQAWSTYGASSCSHYFNGPFFSPLIVADTVTGNSGSYLTCSGANPVFTGLTKFCSDNSGFSGTPTLSITGPNGFSDIINSGDIGTSYVVDTGDYEITPNLPASPTSCISCDRTICIRVTSTDLGQCLVLPVELNGFSARCSSGIVELEWETISERSNAYFEVQRSADASHFHPLKKIQTQQANSLEPLSYRYQDAAPLPGNNFYRLLQADQDGRITYSPIKRADCTDEDSYGSMLLYPNPARELMQIEFRELPVGEGTLEVFSTTGVALVKVPLGQAKKQVLDISALSPGLYLVLLREASGQVYSRRRILVN